MRGYWSSLNCRKLLNFWDNWYASFGGCVIFLLALQSNSASCLKTLSQQPCFYPMFLSLNFVIQYTFRVSQYVVATYKKTIKILWIQFGISGFNMKLYQYICSSLFSVCSYIGHPLGRSLTNHLTEQPWTNMSSGGLHRTKWNSELLCWNLLVRMKFSEVRVSPCCMKPKLLWIKHMYQKVVYRSNLLWKEVGK